MSWSWRLLDAEGKTMDGPDAPVSPPQGSQADAESWLGEHFRHLSEAGVAQVTLLDAGTEVYGPMSLSEQ